MFRRRSNWAKRLALAILTGAASVPAAQAQYGPVFSGSGPVNRSMGGTAVAAPIDATGANFWNPATTTAVPNSLDFGLEFLWPRTTLSSSLPASAFGPGIPPVPLSGSDRGDNGVFALPNVGLVYHDEDSQLTFGLGLFAVAGFGVDYAASTTNPILTPQPPNGLGLGSIFSELQVLQVAPTVAMQVTDRLSIGFGPTLSLATLRAAPLFVASPDDANGDGFASYPNGGPHTRVHWGGGFQVGAYYTLDDSWRLGASVKSPQWFETFRFHTVDENGRPRDTTFSADLPLIISAGVAYAGFERWLLAADFHWIDFANTDPFRQSGFDATGAVRGLGWDSSFCVSVGAQYELTNCTSLRLGYSFSDNPIPDSQSSFNVASPTIVQHTIYVGASYKVSDALTLSVSYLHAFDNSIDGPLVTPFGAIPGSSIRNTTSADALTIGGTVRFGGSPACDHVR